MTSSVVPTGKEEREEKKVKGWKEQNSEVPLSKYCLCKRALHCRRGLGWAVLSAPPPDMTGLKSVCRSSVKQLYKVMTSAGLRL